MFGRDSLGMLLDQMSQGITQVRQAQSTAQECAVGIFQGVLVPRVVQIPRWDEPRYVSSVEDCAGNPLGPEQWAAMATRRAELGLAPYDPDDLTRDYRAEAAALGAPEPDWTRADRFTPLTIRLTRTATAVLNPRDTMHPFERFPKLVALTTSKYGKVLGWTQMPAWHAGSERWFVLDSPEEGQEVGQSGRPDSASTTREVRPGQEEVARAADQTWGERLRGTRVTVGHATTGQGLMGDLP